jgi:hypothetical protein
MSSERTLRQNLLIHINAFAVLLAQGLRIVTALRGLKPDLILQMP